MTISRSRCHKWLSSLQWSRNFAVWSVSTIHCQFRKNHFLRGNTLWSSLIFKGAHRCSAERTCCAAAAAAIVSQLISRGQFNREMHWQLTQLTLDCFKSNQMDQMDVDSEVVCEIWWKGVSEQGKRHQLIPAVNAVRLCTSRLFTFCPMQTIAFTWDQRAQTAFESSCQHKLLTAAAKWCSICGMPTIEYFSAAIRCTSPATVNPEENKRKSLHGHYMVTAAYAKCSAQCGPGRLPFKSCLCFELFFF